MKKIISFILTLVTVLTLTFTLTACKGDESMENNNENSKQIGTHYMVNNGLADLAANGAVTVVDKSTAIAYSTYLASEDKLGESDQLVKLTKFNVLQPANATWVTVFDRDKDFDGQRLSESTVVSLDSNYLRVYAVNMVDYKYYYKDVNKKTLEVGELKELKFKTSLDSEPIVFSMDNINGYLSSQGHQAFKHLMLGSSIVTVDGKFYANFCGGEGMDNFMFMESTDCETWNCVSVVKHKVNYEAVLTYHDNKFWTYCRNGFTRPTTETRENLLYSEDGGKTWKQSNLALTSSDTRPALFIYQGELYLAYSSPLDVEYSTIRPWRCNIHVGKIVSNNGVETFEEVLYKESKYGIVYYSLFDYYGKMIMLYSSGELHPEEGTMGDYTQGKDCLMYTVLKQQDPILKIKA